MYWNNNNSGQQSIAFSRKRQCLAVLLLLVLCSHRIVGLLSTDLVYLMEVNAAMDDREQAIADRIRTDSEVEVHVELQSDEQMEWLQTLGYSAPSIFSEDVDGETVYYTIDDPMAKAVEYEHFDTEPQPLGTSDKFPTASPDQRLSKFFFWDHHFHFSRALPLQVRGRTVPVFLDKYGSPVPTPPPKKHA
ncbi:MAG: hypothetical protein R2824_12800 [Saprospiraceae bacterium]|nr:hypothetical protein [Lewinella sp.]